MINASLRETEQERVPNYTRYVSEDAEVQIPPAGHIVIGGMHVQAEAPKRPHSHSRPHAGLRVGGEDSGYGGVGRVVLRLVEQQREKPHPRRPLIGCGFN